MCLPLKFLRIVFIFISVIDLIIGVGTLILGIYLAQSTQVITYDHDGQQKQQNLSTFGIVVLIISTSPIIAGISEIIGACKKNLCFLIIYVVVHTLGSLAVTGLLLIYYLVYAVGKAVTSLPEGMEIAKIVMICFCVYLWITDILACAIMCHPDRTKLYWQQKFQEDQVIQMQFMLNNQQNTTQTSFNTQANQPDTYKV